MADKNQETSTVYVNKYDYMRHYTRCDAVQFLHNAQIAQAIKQLTDYYKKLAHVIPGDDDDEDDEDEFENEKIDPYSQLREDELNGAISLASLSIADKRKEDDPQIIEGIIIDQKAKEFIKSQYKVDVVIDYDDPQYEKIRFNNELSAKQTKNDIDQLLSANKTFILFQPTFINETAEHHKYVTKCDCVVYLGNDQCYLIEVKGTSSSKLIHFLDFLFQSFVLDGNKDLIFSNYYLCLVKYCRAKKNQIPLILDEYINLSKSAPQIDKKKKPTNEKDLIALKEKYKLGKYQILIEKAVNNNLSEDEVFQSFINTGMEEKTAQRTYKRSFATWQNMINELSQTFESTINKISENKAKVNLAQKVINLLPCAKCKSQYKNCEYWLKCRELFRYEYKTGRTDLYPYLFSANVFEKHLQLDAYENMKVDHLTYIDEKYFKEQYKPFLKNQDNNHLDATMELWAKLQSKPKRVYFDFESINTAIRPMDNVFPFNQVITQNSIIKTKDYYDEYFTEDMIVDPIDINVAWIKAIIDHLYEGDDAWYIVYNKNFESVRLQEMDDLLKDPAYSLKIQCIRNNIFDLADFFNAKTLLLNDLHGFYSIKKVLELIPDSILKETKSVPYPTLEQVHKGDEAQNVTTKRFFHLMDDEEWQTTAHNLQLYCQNDVRAMIAVEKFIKYKYIDKTLK